jgi:hypothetical protein
MSRVARNLAIASALSFSAVGGSVAYSNLQAGRVPMAEPASTTAASAAKKLEGRCSCGKAKWVGSGAPEFTFNCHCSLCRRSGGAAFVAAAAFKPENVLFSGDIVEHKPANSKVPRRFCAHCHTYLAEDARPVLGVFALPLGLADPKVDVAYAPTQHIFYDSRVIDGTWCLAWTQARGH